MSEHTWRELERADMDTAAAHAVEMENRAGQDSGRTGELKPCPHCGSDDIAPITFKGCNGDVWDEFIACGGCGATAETAEAWNMRAERTCRDANTRFNAWTCSECKCTLLLMFDDFGEPTLNVDGVASVPNYCPNCGRKVES